MVVWCNIDRFNSATLRITEDSAKQLMINPLYTGISMYWAA